MPILFLPPEFTYVSPLFTFKFKNVQQEKPSRASKRRSLQARHQITNLHFQRLLLALILRALRRAVKMTTALLMPTITLASLWRRLSAATGCRFIFLMLKSQAQMHTLFLLFD